jgi:hypothetical protein
VNVAPDSPLRVRFQLAKIADTERAGRPVSRDGSGHAAAADGLIDQISDIRRRRPAPSNAAPTTAPMSSAPAFELRSIVSPNMMQI